MWCDPNPLYIYIPLLPIAIYQWLYTSVLGLQAITGFREREKSRWVKEESLYVVKRLKEATAAALPARALTPLPLLHVLDLAKDG